MLKRSAGILLHPTSLPSRFGIGDFGPEAYRWVDQLEKAQQQWWQLLPMTPTGYADSPYQSVSAFAGNPNLISPELLREDGLLREDDLYGPPFPENYVDFSQFGVVDFKNRLLERAWVNFKGGKASQLKADFDAFQQRESVWLDDFSLYMAIKNAHSSVSWLEWGEEYRARDPRALQRVRENMQDDIQQQIFRQFLFDRQWQALKSYAASKNIRIIGDMPIFVSGDSADVWSHPEYFQLDEQRKPRVIAGVPPDYFSPTGQLWGNPLYDWDALRASGYQWWVERMRKTLQQVDLVRIDHYRGFEAYWEVPGDQETAQNGRWVKGPGYDLFDTLQKALGENLPIIAEDLGIITPEVEALRLHYHFPGMRILQFAFAGAVEDRFLPHNYVPNTIVYTGTHDNDTTVGWYAATQPKEKEFINQYLGYEAKEISWDLIRLAWSSVAVLAVAPLQDVLALGSSARMNLPGQRSGYWRWRYRKSMLQNEHLERLAQLTRLYGREG